MNEYYKRLEEFVRNIRDDYDCDSDAHRYNTGCRVCEADKVLESNPLIQLVRETEAAGGYESELLDPTPEWIDEMDKRESVQKPATTGLAAEVHAEAVARGPLTQGWVSSLGEPDQWGLYHDRVHKESGVARAASAVKVGARESVPNGLPWPASPPAHDEPAAVGPTREEKRAAFLASAKKLGPLPTGLLAASGAALGPKCGRCGGPAPGGRCETVAPPSADDTPEPAGDTPKTEENNMLDEYDFSKGVRGKYYGKT